MKKIVNLLGLYQPEMIVRKIDSRDAFEGDVWSLNDWYWVYPWLKKVERSFELHPFRHVKKEMQTNKVRYRGDWKRAFKYQVDDWMVMDKRWGKEAKRPVTIFDYKRLKETYPVEYASSIDCMIIQAIDDGYEMINIFGVQMLNEHAIYGGSLLKSIDEARFHGIDIRFDYEYLLRPKTFKKQPSYIEMLYKNVG